MKLYERTLTIDSDKHDISTNKVDLLINGKNINGFIRKITCEIIYSDDEKDKFDGFKLNDMFNLTEEEEIKEIK